MHGCQQMSNSWSQVAIIAMAYFASTGIVSFSLGLLFSDFLWSYLLGTFLQASAITMALVSVNVLFFEPLQPVKKRILKGRPKVS